MCLGAFGFLFAVTDYGHGVFELVERRPRGQLMLANFALEFTDAVGGRGAAAEFYLLQFAIEMAEFFDGLLDFLRKILPLTEQKGRAANGDRSFDTGAGEFTQELPARLLV